MKYLIVGLGNPGPEYQATRHNIGFMTLDLLVEKAGKTFASDRLGSTCELRHKGRIMVLLKPMTYMNLSGKALRYHQQAHKIPQENILVITDDLALPFGKQRLRGKGSSGGHNGLKNIEEILGNDAYARLRMGVGSEFSKGAQVDFVLSAFNPDEQKQLPAILARAGETVLSFATQGLERTMSQFN
jgi:PTH1 family peptidyl-tRNA hydrolase